MVPPPEARFSSSKLSQRRAAGEKIDYQGAGRNLEKFFRVGGHLQTTTVKDGPQRKGLPPNADPGQCKVVQGEAERAGKEKQTLLDCKIAAGRTRAGGAVDSRAIKTTVQALKDKGSVRGFKAPELDPGNWVATHRPPIKGNLSDGSKVRIGIHGNLHNNTEDSRTKEERPTPHTKEENRVTAHC